MFKIRAVLIIVLVVLGNTLAISRNIDGYENDTVRPADTVYSLGDIPIVSAELISQTRQEIVDLIPDGTIKKLKAHNTLLLASIHPELLVPVDSTDPSKNISFLKIRIMDLTQAQRKTEEEISALSGIVQNLDQIKSRLTHQLVKWTNTRVKLERDSTVIKAPVKLYETLDFLDSTLILITRKSSAIMEVLDKTIATNAIIEAQIAKAHELITSKQLQAFNSDHPGFFSLDFSRMFGSEIFNAFETFSKMNVDDFVHYLKTHGNIGFFILLLFGFFVYLFVIIRKKVVIRNTGFGYFYKEMIKRVIDHPVSASIILVMLFSMGLFPDRPLLFRELTFYIIAFPVIQLTSNLLPKRYHSYIYAFGAIIIFYVLILVFPSEFVIYRVLLLFISIAEIVLLTMFVIYFFKKQELEKSRKQLIYFFVYLHLALAVVGFISNLAGRVTLTEIVIFAIFSNIFFGLAIFIGVILLNGIVVSMVDNYRKPRLNVFKLYGEEIKRKAIYLFNFLALVFWIGTILQNFLLLKFIYEGIISIFTQKIVLGSTSFSFDTIIIFFIVIYVSIVFASLLRVVLEEDVLKRFSLSKGLPHTIAMMVKYTMIVAGFILAINAAG
ncbi:MAG TPA: hypothetical protein PKN21_09950, partial [Bacteroidales bacterium]|nr:hypothetical protein [Bacteroidales bacterium]